MTGASLRLLATLLAPLGLPGSAQAASGPPVDTATGHVVLEVDDGSIRDDVDAGGVSHAVALPGGSTLLFGAGGAGDGVLYATKIGLRGTLDRSFGSGGVTALPAPGGATSALRQVLRQPDGKLLFISAWHSTLPGFAPNDLLVTRTHADFSLDWSYGLGGTRLTGLGEGCGSCTPAALAPDGSLVLTGSTGDVPSPPAPSKLRWALTRLTAAGTIDTSFGAGGIATIATDMPASGFNVALGPGGTIVTEAQAADGSDSRLLLTRLTPRGAADPAFAGGTPIVTRCRRVLQCWPRTTAPSCSTARSLAPQRHERLARYSPAGVLDDGFGSGGFVDLGRTTSPVQLPPADGGSVLVAEATGVALAVRSVTAQGAIAGRRDLRLRFGGGTSSFLLSVRPRLWRAYARTASAGDNSCADRTGPTSSTAQSRSSGRRARARVSRSGVLRPRP